MKRLLCIIGSMDVGGAESFLMKVYRNINNEHYKIDFAVATSKNSFYEKEIISLGGEIYHIPSKSNSIFSNILSIYKLVSKKKYKYVLRISQHSISAIDLIAARLGGAKICAFRSSNTKTTDASHKEMLLHHLFIFLPKCFANVRFAPSTESAEYMFGKGCIKKGTAFIIRNGINLSEFKYNEKVRNEYRKKLNIENNFVVGHVGRFERQKNHLFLIRIFKQIKTKIKNAVLILVGTGELEIKIRKYIEENELTDSVIFTGIRSDISNLLNAMDVFVFPSFYEGMPNAVIEAQATGLPCIISDTITTEVKITPLIKFLSLNKSEIEWSNSVIQMMSNHRNNQANSILAEKKYDIKYIADEFIKRIFK